MSGVSETAQLDTNGAGNSAAAVDPTFYIADIPIKGDVMLAPMAGFADIPTRAICRQFGSAVGYTEFVAVEEILSGSSRALSLLDFDPADRPMVFQIFGNEAEKILLAAQKIEALGPDIIDINMGCSTRRVSGRGAGVGMMMKPGLIAQTFRLLTRHLSVPITGKIRLGWEANQNYLEVAHIMEENGAAMIAIHPRTKEQQYRGEARWDAITELRQAVGVPVVGNGDVMVPADIDDMLAQTGCQAVMIGRGALGNPWLFGRIDKRELTFDEVARAMTHHLELMLDYHGERGLILFRKHVKRYLGDLPQLKPHNRTMVTADNVKDFLAALAVAQDEFGDQAMRALTG